MYHFFFKYIYDVQYWSTWPTQKKIYYIKITSYSRLCKTSDTTNTISFIIILHCINPFNLSKYVISSFTIFQFGHY